MITQNITEANTTQEMMRTQGVNKNLHLVQNTQKQNAIKNILEHFCVNEKQANFIYEKFLKAYKTQEQFNEFFRFYLDSLLDEKIVGTSFEKVLIVARKAEIELIGRFVNKEVFIKWIEKRYKRKSFFRVYEKDFFYNDYYETYSALSNDYVKVQKQSPSDEFLVGFDEFGNLIKINSLQKVYPIENGEFKEALLDFIFQNQERLELDLNKPFKDYTQTKTEKEFKDEEQFIERKAELDFKIKNIELKLSNHYDEIKLLTQEELRHFFHQKESLKQEINKLLLANNLVEAKSKEEQREDIRRLQERIGKINNLSSKEAKGSEL